MWTICASKETLRDDHINLWVSIQLYCYVSIVVCLLVVSYILSHSLSLPSLSLCSSTTCSFVEYTYINNKWNSDDYDYETLSCVSEKSVVQLRSMKKHVLNIFVWIKNNFHHFDIKFHQNIVLNIVESEYTSNQILW